MSGEGISGRKPYGLRTRMIECIGWKRLEANRMFQFMQVSKKDFNAILRRSLLFRILARFEDPRAIEGAPDPRKRCHAVSYSYMEVIL